MHPQLGNYQSLFQNTYKHLTRYLLRVFILQDKEISKADLGPRRKKNLENKCIYFRAKTKKS